MHNSKKKKLIIANTCLLLFLIIGCVFAWFATNYNNQVDVNQVEVVVDNALELSLDNKHWKSNINLATDEATNAWFSSIKFTDITGSGNGTFYRPVLTQGDNGASVNTNEAFGTPTFNIADGDYVKLTLHMRSKDPLNVKLGDGSYLKPLDESLIGSGVTNPSSGTDSTMFSRDIVVGGMRISAIDNSEHLFTWIPRPDVYVNTTGNITYENILLNQTNDDSLTHFYLDSNNIYTPVALDSTKTITGDITESNEKILATLTGTTDDYGYYTDSVDICIWLEGCDNEARRAFVGGKFKLYLNLISEDAVA